MRALKAQVRGGRFVVEEPANLPEGTEVEVYVPDGEEFSPEERAVLLRAIEEGAEAIERGHVVDGIAFANDLLARREARTR